MNARFNQRSLFWKEWRSRRWTLAALIGLIVLGPPLVGAFQRVLQIGGDSLLSTDAQALVACLTFVLAVFILGAGLFAPEERDPARSFLYTLPISRTGILGAKLGALAIQAALLVGALLAIMDLWGAVQPPSGAWGKVFPYAILFSVPGIALAAILGLHVRSPLVTVLMAIGAGYAVFIILHVDALVGPAGRQEISLPGIGETVKCILAAAALIGWLFFLFCRTPVQELNPTPGFLLGVLFVVAVIEVFFTVFLCNWRDLAFILFGV